MARSAPFWSCMAETEFYSGHLTQSLDPRRRAACGPVSSKDRRNFSSPGYNSTCSSRTFSSRIGIPVFGVRGQGISRCCKIVGETSLIEAPVLPENAWVRGAERVHQPVGDRLLVRQETFDQGHVERRSRRFDRG